MKVVIAGSRTIRDKTPVAQAIIDAGFDITEVVQGGAVGVDTLARTWGLSQGIPVTTFNAQWEAFGKRAGPMRNREMAQYADALIAVWDGQSRGTSSMIYEMNRQKKPVFVYRLPS